MPLLAARALRAVLQGQSARRNSPVAGTAGTSGRKRPIGPSPRRSPTRVSPPIHRPARGGCRDERPDQRSRLLDRWSLAVQVRRPVLGLRPYPSSRWREGQAAGPRHRRDRFVDVALPGGRLPGHAPAGHRHPARPLAVAIVGRSGAGVAASDDVRLRRLPATVVRRHAAPQGAELPRVLVQRVLDLHSVARWRPPASSGQALPPPTGHPARLHATPDPSVVPGGRS